MRLLGFLPRLDGFSETQLRTPFEESDQLGFVPVLPCLFHITLNVVDSGSTDVVRLVEEELDHIVHCVEVGSPIRFPGTLCFQVRLSRQFCGLSDPIMPRDSLGYAGGRPDSCHNFLRRHCREFFVCKDSCLIEAGSYLWANASYASKIIGHSCHLLVMSKSGCAFDR